MKLNPNLIDKKRTRKEIGYYTQIDRKSAGYTSKEVSGFSKRLYKGRSIGRILNTPFFTHGGDRKSKNVKKHLNSEKKSV